MSTNLSTGGMEFEPGGYHQGPFIASTNKKKFHLLTCIYAACLHAGNSELYGTRGEAIASGRKPCGTCYS